MIIPPILVRTRDRMLALRVFTPGIVMVVLLHVLFISLEQGRDIVRQTFENGWRMGYLGVATIFLAYITWYGARLRALALWDRVKLHPRIRKLMPRLLGHGTYMAALVGMVRMGDDLRSWTSECPVILAIVLDLTWFVLLRFIAVRLMEMVGSNTRWMRHLLTTFRVALFVLAASLVAVGECMQNVRWAPVLIMGLMQGCFTLIVNVRSKWVRELNPDEAKEDPTRPNKTWWNKFFPRKWGLRSSGQEEMLPYGIELRHFKHFNAISLLVLAFMLIVWYVPTLAIGMGPFAVAWFCFGILLGFFHLLAWVSKKSGAPLTTMLFFLILGMGYFWDHHEVTVTPTAAQAKARCHFEERWHTWSDRIRNDSPDTSAVPIIFVLADGGASRSGYWVNRVLQRLHSQDERFYPALFSLSGASGGSVGVAAYYQHAVLDHYKSTSDTSRFSDTLALGNDMLSSTVSHMLGPDLVNLLFPFRHDRARALELAMERTDTLWRTTARSLFSCPDTGHRPILCLNTTRMGDGQPGVVCSVSLDNVSTRIDLLDSLPPDTDLHMSTAAVLSSRFPYVSPAGWLMWKGQKHYFVDGGYFDNSGAGVTTEMLARIEALAGYGTGNVAPWFKRLRPIVIHISNSPPPKPEQKGNVHPLSNDLAAPLLTVLGTYSSQTNINDQRLEAHLDRVFKDIPHAYIEINLYQQAQEEEFSMSWSMSTRMRERLDALALRHPAVQQVFDALDGKFP